MTEGRVADYFGRYELLELLGRGGMGEVYRAHDTTRGRDVALKLLPEHLATDPRFMARFRRESRLAAQLSDPHIVPIHDFGEIDGRLFIDMRLVAGSDLGSVLADRGALPAPVVVDILTQVASALDAAHADDLVHRDVKPSNVMLTGLNDDLLGRPPFAYLVDFGIARSTQPMTALTDTASAAIGTAAYMAPERIAGEPGDGRVDVYALACVLFEALTGEPPFAGELVSLIYQHLHVDPPAAAAHRPELPAGLDAVIARGMAKSPHDRYATAGDLALAARQAVAAAPAAVPVSPAPARRPTPVGRGDGARRPRPTGQSPAALSTPVVPATSAVPSAPAPPHRGDGGRLGRPAGRAAAEGGRPAVARRHDHPAVCRLRGLHPAAARGGGALRRRATRASCGPARGVVGASRRRGRHRG